MNKEADLLDTVYAKLNNQQLIRQLEKDYVGFSKSPKGKLIYSLYSMIPSTYDVDSYRAYKDQQPVKIIFTGVGDSDLSKISKNQFNKRYPDKKLYFFGWPQYQQAMIFASRLDPKQPVQVYGHSWGSNAARKFIQNYQGNIVGGHFFDPMRRDVQGDKTLQITKDVPITYTPIVEQPRNIKTALHNALRWQPSQRMLVTQAASKHDSVSQWLNILDKPEEVKKVANFLFKYGSYSQCLTKIAQTQGAPQAPNFYRDQYNRYRAPGTNSLYPRYPYRQQTQTDRLSDWNALHVLLNAIMDTQTSGTKKNITSVNGNRTSSNLQIQQRTLNSLIDRGLLRHKDPNIDPRKYYTVKAMHSNPDIARQVAATYLATDVLRRVRKQTGNPKLQFYDAVRQYPQLLYTFYTYGPSDEKAYKIDSRQRIPKFRNMLDMNRRRFQYQYNNHPQNANARLSLFKRTYHTDANGNRYFLRTLRPGQTPYSIFKNWPATIKMLKYNGYPDYKSDSLKHIPNNFAFKILVPDGYDQVYQQTLLPRWPQKKIINKKPVIR